MNTASSSLLSHIQVCLIFLIPPVQRGFCTQITRLFQEGCHGYILLSKRVSQTPISVLPR